VNGKWSKWLPYIFLLIAALSRWPKLFPPNFSAFYGLAFCAGLAKEAAIVDEILRSHGFDTVSVVCKAGAIPKEEIGVTDDEKVFIGQHESMCNPILQAALLNDAATEFNIVLGLCVGHDSLFFRYAKASTTVLAVKDRVMGHNPLACLYTEGNYSSWVRNPPSVGRE